MQHHEGRSYLFKKHKGDTHAEHDNLYLDHPLGSQAINKPWLGATNLSFVGGSVIICR